MKRKLYTLISIGILLMSIPVFGQKTVVVVEPDEGLEIGALNTAVASAADPGNTIFELRRDGLYLLNGIISHEGYTLHIRAEESPGARPILQPAVDDLGASDNHFAASGDLILEGLYICGKNELGVDGSPQIKTLAEGLKIIVEDCYFDYSNGANIYLSSINNNIYFSNSITRNATQPANASNGRVIDTRGNPQDTIVIEKSTMYRISAKTISGPDFIKYLKFDHNTSHVCNLTSVFTLGATVEAQITNNIFYNYCLRGYRNYTNNCLFAMDSIFTIGEFTDADRSFDISHNNWYTEPQYMEYILDYTPPDGSRMSYTFALNDIEQTDTIWYTSYKCRTELFHQPVYDTIVFKTWKSWPEVSLAQNFVISGQIDTTNFIREPLVFKNPPPFFANYWKFYIENEWSIKGTNPPSDAYADEDTLTIGEVTTGAFDFSYNDNSMSATGAKDGGPLGDPRWVPYSTVSTENITAKASAKVRAFPNPFTESLTFEIDAKESSSVRIVVYDLVGKEVLSVNDNVNEGSNAIQVNFRRNLNSGIYLYQVQLESANGMKSISSGKIAKR